MSWEKNEYLVILYNVQTESLPSIVLFCFEKKKLVKHHFVSKKLVLYKNNILKKKLFVF